MCKRCEEIVEGLQRMADRAASDPELAAWSNPDDNDDDNDDGWLAQTPVMSDKVIGLMEETLALMFDWSNAKLEETGREHFRMARIEANPVTPNMALVLIHELQMRRALENVSDIETFNL